MFGISRGLASAFATCSRCSGVASPRGGAAGRGAEEPSQISPGRPCENAGMAKYRGAGHEDRRRWFPPGRCCLRLPTKSRKADAPVRIIEVTCDVIRGRWRDRDASKWVERGHIRADEVQFQIGAAYLERLLARSPEMQFGRPILQSCVHLVWPGRPTPATAARRRRSARRPAGRR